MVAKVKTDNFLIQCDLIGLPKPIPEFRFHPTRMWRFDYCWPEPKIAVEIEGGIWTSGRHNHPIGFTKDMEKYNAASAMGYRIFRFTPKQANNGVAAAEMYQVLEFEGCL